MKVRRIKYDKITINFLSDDKGLLNVWAQVVPYISFGEGENVPIESISVNIGNGEFFEFFLNEETNENGTKRT